MMPSLRGGGAERVMLTLANGLAARGVRVDMVLLQADGLFMQQLSSDVRVIDLKAPQGLLAVPAIANYLRRASPSAALTALNYPNVLVPLARLLARKPVRVVASAHNVITPATEQQHPAKRAAIRTALAWSFRRADEVICVSKGVAQDVSRMSGIPLERLRVVYNPIDYDDILAHAGVEPEHPWLSPGNPPVIIGAGRLVPQKDFETLLRGFAALRLRRDTRLIVLGSGRERSALETLSQQLGIASDVAFVEFVARPYAWMKRARVFALTSWWEGFGMVLLEAMAVGCSVVATSSVGGVGEILEGGKWGRTVPLRDPVALADALELAIDHPLDATTRAQDFTVERAVDGYLEAILGRR